jgi:hypothetical protein
MAETLISPGYLTRENDQSQITQLPIAVGAAFVGPTLKGPLKLPTVVRSYNDYLATFGGAFISGGQSVSYLTTTAIYNYFQNGGQTALVTRVASGSFSSATASISSSVTVSFAFTLETISQGTIMNSVGPTGSNGALLSGSANNIRWEIPVSSTGSGTFTLLIRRGDDTANSKIVLETFRDLSLDPNADNFISKAIGDQKQELVSNQIVTTGTYPNISNYVRVRTVTTTPNYFDNSGTPQTLLTGSIPVVGSGSFGGATGSVPAGAAFYDQISSTNIQGLAATDYDDVITLLSNQDDYKYNVLSFPGLTLQNASTQLATAALNTQGRGDAILVVDPSNYGETQAATINRVRTNLDNSYVATYWPWLRVVDPAVGKQVWVPAGTLIPGVYAYSDKVSAPWFAPAGLNRGALNTVLFAERKLASSDRDALYIANINPIATFPNNPVVVYGQKTSQKKASALDRVNVRRLLIELKSYIGQIANTLVIEQNSDATRLSFLGRVNPYLENIQQRQGLYAFRVVMDDTNNTADVIDRNELVGQIYIQPTRTAEFVLLDFNIQPTGATFPS